MRCGGAWWPREGSPATYNRAAHALRSSDAGVERVFGGARVDDAATDEVLRRAGYGEEAGADEAAAAALGDGDGVAACLELARDVLGEGGIEHDGGA